MEKRSSSLTGGAGTPRTHLYLFERALFLECDVRGGDWDGFGVDCAAGAGRQGAEFAFDQGEKLVVLEMSGGGEDHVLPG